ncbi:MAG: DEAD/DEAH box helicase [Rhodospirillaceae bacterium]|jgi:superfamily II DNA/RNA helicase|nr:DEAD/DEAH box helicase [Rhodospirillaceae bacterium]
MTFEDLGLSPEVLQAVTDAGYETPTPIQEQAIPFVLMGRDVLGCAQTGTGKTASFTLPMIDILSNGRARARMPRSLIITPTRELASQISENFEIYGKYNKLTMALLIGGVSFDEQNAKLDRGVDVLIATPGRLLDHFERGRILLTDIKILVIDEADRMMDMGFIPDVERIVSLLPKIRNTLFFSATMPPEIRRLADKFLINPKEITVSPNTSTAETVKQFLAVVEAEASVKRDALRRLIRSENVENALIFCNRKRDVDILTRSLKKHEFNAAALHGDMSQPARLETLQAFKEGTTHILVASDVAARGLDLPKVSHVFNFDVPSHAEDYVHRIGRTGRAGREGRALTIATPEDAKFLDAVVRFIGNDITPITVDGVDSADMSDAPPPRRGRGRSKGPAKRPAKRPARKRTSDGPAKVYGADKPIESKPIEAKPIEAKPIEAKPIEAKPIEAKPVDIKSTEQKPQRAQPSAEQKPRRPRQSRKENSDTKPVLGMGSHVPAFMLRSARTSEE